MLCINHNNTKPYFNLASEEYLLKNFDDDIFMLWRNEPCIVIGKNQNTMEEINYDYVKEHNLPVVRRLTGGGAVFHDLGNINFTFISSGGKDNFNNFKKFTTPIIDVLNSLGVKAEFTGRNDLTIEGKKFSGNAQCRYKNRVLHHGTLLFSSEIKDLSASLKVSPEKLKGKGVKSVESRVTNISSHLHDKISIDDFREKIMNHINNTYGDCSLYNLTEKDLYEINKLVEDKYSTWQWNFGSSPEYSYNSKVKYEGGTIEFHFNVKKGIISEFKVYGDFFGDKDIQEFESKIIGLPHREEDILAAVSELDLPSYFSGAKGRLIIDLFF